MNGDSVILYFLPYVSGMKLWPETPGTMTQPQNNHNRPPNRESRTSAVRLTL